MSAAYQPIGDLQLLLALGLLVLSLVLSWLLRLGLERRLLWAGVRMTAQLVLLGLVLEWVFSVDRPLVVLAMAALMTAVAGHTAVGRSSRRVPGALWHGLVSVAGAAFVVTGVALRFIVDVEPWHDPQYLIPLLGMVLGNSLTGISLGLDRFLDGCVSEGDRILFDLALGAGVGEATGWLVRDAVRTALVPTVNAMLVMGLVSLPGMMTGQILAGADPMDAVRYQIVIMCMILTGVLLASVGVVLLARRTVLPADARPRFDRIQEAV